MELGANGITVNLRWNVYCCLWECPNEMWFYHCDFHWKYPRHAFLKSAFHCSFSPLFRLTTKYTPKPTLLTLCTRNPSMTGGFLAQRVSKHVNHFEDVYDISNHCSFSPLFRLTTKCTSKPTLLTLCTRNPSMTGGFLAQRVSKHVNHFEDVYDISNHWSFSPLFRLTTKCSSKPTMLTLCTRNPSMTGEFLAQRVSKHVNHFKDVYDISRPLFLGPGTIVRQGRVLVCVVQAETRVDTKANRTLIQTLAAWAANWE